jgi:hypothetical protein
LTATGHSLRSHGRNAAGREQYEGKCPARPDGRPSLSVTFDDRGVTCTCHAGCTREAVATAIGRWSNRVSDRRPRLAKVAGPPGKKRAYRNPTLEAAVAYLGRKNRWARVSAHPYHRLDGREHFAVVRFRDAENQKQFKTVKRRSIGLAGD